MEKKIKINVDQETQDAMYSIVDAFTHLVESRFEEYDFKTRIDSVQTKIDSMCDGIIGDNENSLRKEIVKKFTNMAEDINKLAEPPEWSKELANGLLSVISPVEETRNRLSILEKSTEKIENLLTQSVEILNNRQDDLIKKHDKILAQMSLPWWKKVLGGLK